MKVTDFKQRLSSEYYMDPLMSKEVINAFFVDKVVQHGNYRMILGVGRVPHFGNKYNDVPAWVHPKCDLLTSELFTEREKDGIRASRGKVPSSARKPIASVKPRRSTKGTPSLWF